MISVESSTCNSLIYIVTTVKPVYKGHPRDQTKVAVMSRWPFYTGSLTHNMVLWDFEIVAFISRGLLYTGGHYSRFYCISWFTAKYLHTMDINQTNVKFLLEYQIS